MPKVKGSLNVEKNLELGGYKNISEIIEPDAPADNNLRIYAEARNDFTVLKTKTFGGKKFQFLRDNFMVVRNQSGFTIDENTLVHIDSSNGNFPVVVKAKADSLDTLPTLGFAIDEIPDNSFGRILFRGQLSGIDTSGLIEGQPIYVSADVAGEFTQTKPELPNYIQKIGVVIKAHSNGIIEVDVDAREVPSMPKTATYIIGNVNNVDSQLYDYVTDGTDDDVQINLAISELPVSGGRIILREGDYVISDTILMNKSNVVLEGQGYSTKVKLANSTHNDMIALGTSAGSFSNIVVRNFLLDGNMANNNSGNGIIINDDASYSIVEDMTIKETVDSNIYYVDAPYTIIRNNYLDTTKENGNWSNIEGGGLHSKIEGNTCILGDYAGIAIYNNRDTIIHNNLIIDSRSWYIYTDYDGIQIEGNMCIVNNNPTAPIIITRSTGGIVRNNTVIVKDSVTTATVALDIDNWGYQVTGNYIFFDNANYAHIGIKCDNSSDAQITGNFILNIDETATDVGSIGIICTQTNNVISGNYINAFDVGLYADGMLDTTVNGNFFYNCVIGIDVSGARVSSITANVFDGSDYNIISQTNSYTSNLSIANNSFVTTRKDAIVMRSFKFCSVIGNTFKWIGLLANDTYSSIILKTVSGTNYSKYNTIQGNVFEHQSANNKPKYNIREDSVNDGANIITGNVAIEAVTEQISTQHVLSDVSHNITQ